MSAAMEPSTTMNCLLPLVLTPGCRVGGWVGVGLGLGGVGVGRNEVRCVCFKDGSWPRGWKADLIGEIASSPTPIQRQLFLAY